MRGRQRRPRAGALGVLLGIGGVVGCFAGYWARTRLVKVLGTRDLNVALIEDIIALAGSIWAFKVFAISKKSDCHWLEAMPQLVNFFISGSLDHG